MSGARPSGQAAAVPSLLAQAYARWREPLRRLLRRRLGRPEDAEDAVQDVFVRYAVAAKALPAEEEAPYLHTIARHVAHDAWHRAQRHEARTADAAASDADVPDEHADPVRDAAYRERLARLAAALAELPERRREAFVLHSIDGLTQTDVAERMGISRRMVHNHVTLAFAYCQMRVRYRSAEDMRRAQHRAGNDTHDTP